MARRLGLTEATWGMEEALADLGEGVILVYGTDSFLRKSVEESL